MRISDGSSDVCASDLAARTRDGIFCVVKQGQLGEPARRAPGVAGEKGPGGVHAQRQASASVVVDGDAHVRVDAANIGLPDIDEYRVRVRGHDLARGADKSVGGTEVVGA